LSLSLSLSFWLTFIADTSRGLTKYSPWNLHALCSPEVSDCISINDKNILTFMDSILFLNIFLLSVGSSELTPQTSQNDKKKPELGTIMG